MTLLVLGCRGQVGRELCRQAKASGLDVCCLSHEQLDVTDEGAVDRLLSRTRFLALINAAAYTAVDRAETEVAQAYAVNRDGPGYLAAACAKNGIPLIHISTDYVFDGSKSGSYNEDDQVAPLGVYGASKAAGEALVRERATQHIILRTAWVYGVWGNNFVKTMLRLGQERDVIRVVDDQYGCPTAAADIAATILQINSKIRTFSESPWGTYHYCGAGVTTWFRFAQEIFRIARRYRPYGVEVVPIPSSEYPAPVTRPANSVFDMSRIEKQFGIKARDWRQSLREVIESLHQVSM